MSPNAVVELLEPGESLDAYDTRRERENDQPTQEVPILKLSSEPPPLPETMLLGSLRHPTLRLKMPLPVTLSTENEYILVEHNAWGVMGYGTHLTAAIIDLQQTITELFLTLRDEQDKLGGDLPQLWEDMQKMIEER